MSGEQFEVGVYGDGIPAFAAACRLRSMGLSVVLVSPNYTFVRECGWAFLQAAGCGQDADWLEFRRFLEVRGAWADGCVDGACVEVVAGEYARRLGIRFLLAAVPVGWERMEDCVSRVSFSCKGIVRQLTCARWLDASGAQSLSRLVASDPIETCAAEFERAIFFKHQSSRRIEPMSWDQIGVDGISNVRFSPSFWGDESVVRYVSSERGFSAHLLRVLEFARDQVDLGDALVSHASLVAHPRVQLLLSSGRLPENMARVFSAANHVSELFRDGVQAADQVAELVAAPGIGGEYAESSEDGVRDVDVVVAGLGTGGAVAAIAAAREGARVLGFDLMPIPGGTGTAGGIHLYYFGVHGGLQEEVNARVSTISPLFGAPKNIAGFHPVAKAVVLTEMLREAGVTTLMETQLLPVDSPLDGVLRRISIHAPGGRQGVRAKAWIDSTGDGDLAAAAGAEWTGSARSDGVNSAFTQASGRFRIRSGNLFCRIVNFDAGYVDPLEPDDLTRARLLGLSHYESERFSADEHPTMIAPLVGIRQSRHVACDLALTVEDLAKRQVFEDSIGRTACHLDTHAVDFEFESLETAFWIWGCRNWRKRTASDIPYRSLIPRGFKNVLLACRAVGATPEAHQSFRMQRDMQRIGEAAGLASAFAARFGVDVQQVPIGWLRERLMASGALSEPKRQESTFGYSVDEHDFQPADESLEKLIELTRAGFGVHMYLVFRRGGEAVPRLRELLLDPDASWRAAVILAMLVDERAEGRLCLAIESREMGFLDDDPLHPTKCQRLAPNWLTALTFLRACGTDACLDVVLEFSNDDRLVHNARTAVALLCEAVALRCPSVMVRDRVRRILEQITATPAPNAVGAPQRNVAGLDGLEGDLSIWYPTVCEDFRWQLDLAVAKGYVAIGDPIPESAHGYLADHRAYVRKAFAGLMVEEPMGDGSCGRRAVAANALGVN